jgi:hypothetical protein
MMMFSERKHVDPIKTGAKCQTTRSSNRRRIRAGSELHLYFKPRHKRGCHNCIAECERAGSDGAPCPHHTNHFGTVKVLKIEEVDIYKMSREERDEWARLDGFEDFQHADDWFMSRRDECWFCKPVFVITWDAGPVIEKWRKFK